MKLILSVYLFAITITFFFLTSVFTAFNYFSILNPNFIFNSPLNINSDILSNYQISAKFNFYQYLISGLFVIWALFYANKFMKSKLRIVLYSLFLFATFLITILFATFLITISYINLNACNQSNMAPLECLGVFITAPLFTITYFILILIPIILIARKKENIRNLIFIGSILTIFTIVLPLTSYYWAKNFLPKQFEAAILTNIKNLGFEVFEPGYIPQGFNKYREELSFRPNHRYKIVYKIPNTENRLMISQEAHKQIISPFSEAKEKITLTSGVSARIATSTSNDNRQNSTTIWWEYQGTDLILEYTNYPPNENIEIEAIRIAESMKK